MGAGPYTPVSHVVDTNELNEVKVMRSNLIKWATSGAVAAMALATVVTTSAGAATSHTTYFACDKGGSLTHVSVNAHACAAGTKKVTGKFAGADFTNANLSGANLSGAPLARTNLTGVTSGRIVGKPSSLPRGWQLQKGYLIGPSANLPEAKLTGASLAGANLVGANLYGANLTDVDFTKANLNGASLSDANITGTKFAGAILSNVISAYEVGTPASLPKEWNLIDGSYEGNVVAYLVGPRASIGGAQLAGISFKGDVLSNIYMPGSNLVDTDFTGAVIQTGDLASSDLEEANFTNANLKGSNFSNADFEGANFTGANFSGVNFAGARLLSISGTGSTNFTGATCPDGVVYGSPGANC